MRRPNGMPFRSIENRYAYALACVKIHFYSPIRFELIRVDVFVHEEYSSRHEHEFILSVSVIETIVLIAHACPMPMSISGKMRLSESNRTESRRINIENKIIT